MSTIKKLSCKITAVTISFIMILCVLVSFPVSVSAENEIDYPGMAESLAYFINIEREKAGLEPLKVVPYLNSLAAVRALECTIKFSHDRPEYSIDENGEEYYGFDSVIDYSLVPWLWAGENIAAGNSNAEATCAQWMASDDHRLAILNPHYTHLGVALCYVENDPNPDHYHYYWDAIFIGCGIEFEGQYTPKSTRIVPKSPGDVNGDGVVNTFDLITINKYLANEISLNDLQLESADVLGDGKITSYDATVLRKFILGECHTLPITTDMVMDILFKGNS